MPQKKEIKNYGIFKMQVVLKKQLVL